MNPAPDPIIAAMWNEERRVQQDPESYKLFINTMSETEFLTKCNQILADVGYCANKVILEGSEDEINLVRRLMDNLRQHYRPDRNSISAH